MELDRPLSKPGPAHWLYNLEESPDTQFWFLHLLEVTASHLERAWHLMSQRAHFYIFIDSLSSARQLWTLRMTTALTGRLTAFWGYLWGLTWLTPISQVRKLRHGGREFLAPKARAASSQCEHSLRRTQGGKWSPCPRGLSFQGKVRLGGPLRQFARDKYSFFLPPSPWLKENHMAEKEKWSEPSPFPTPPLPRSMNEEKGTQKVSPSMTGAVTHLNL